MINVSQAAPVDLPPLALRQALAEAVGRLWLTGVTVNWSALHTVDSPSNGWLPGRVPLPTYPFERQHYWLEPEAGPGAGIGVTATGTTAAGNSPARNTSCP